MDFMIDFFDPEKLTGQKLEALMCTMNAFYNRMEAQLGVGNLKKITTTVEGALGALMGVKSAIDGFKALGENLPSIGAVSRSIQAFKRAATGLDILLFILDNIIFSSNMLYHYCIFLLCRY